MNYFFLYHLQDGAIHSAPFLGYVDEWTNIPEGCGVIGPIPQEDDTAKDASENPDFYTIQNDILVPLPDIDERRAVIEAEKHKPQPPTQEERLKAAEDWILDKMLGGI